jgi:mannose-1-phosphate guanylyltransferase
VLAVVLVGGLGTRLRPLTETIPKQLLPVAGVAMIERVLAQLARHGVRRAVLSMGYLPDPFLAAFPDRRIGGVDVTFAIEPTPLGTAGAIRYAAAANDVRETFLAVNGDVLTDLDVGALVARHRATGAESTIHLTPVEDPSRYGVVVVGDDGAVREFVEKPPVGRAPSNQVNAGTYVLEPKFLDRVTPGKVTSVEREIFPRMVDEGVLFAAVDTSYWLDAGTPEAYLRANVDVLDGTRRTWHPGRRAGTSLLLDGASVADGATVVASVLSGGVVVGADAVVRRSVVLDGATIESGAAVVDSVVGPGAVVGAGATLEGHCLVAQGARVPAGSRLDGEPVPA